MTGAIARPRERVDFAPLGTRDLREQMRRGAEAVKAEPRRVARGTVRAIADEPRAEQRRGGGIRIALGHVQAIARVRRHVLGVAAGHRIAGELGSLAEILEPAAARRAFAARVGEPRHADALANFHVLDCRADRDDAVAAIVTRTRQFAVRQERWFRRDPRIEWFDLDPSAADPLAPVRAAVIAALG